MIPTQTWWRRFACWLGFHERTAFTDDSGYWCPLCGRDLP